MSSFGSDGACFLAGFQTLATIPFDAGQGDRRFPIGRIVSSIQAATGWIAENGPVQWLRNAHPALPSPL